MMKDLRELFTINGILRDDNDDQVPDAVVLSVIPEDDLAPMGLIDLWARIGLETTEMALPSDSPAPDHHHLRIRLKSDLPNDRAELRLEAPLELTIEGGSESAVNRLLQLLAAVFPDALPSGGGTMTAFHVEGDRIAATLDNETHEIQPVYDEDKQPGVSPEPFLPMESLTQLFSVSGLYPGGRALPGGRGAFGFLFKQKPNRIIVLAATRLAARLGLMSTGLFFPLSAEKETESAGRQVVFIIDETSDRHPGIYLKQKERGNEILLSGDSAGIVRGLGILAEARCPEEGGAWGAWESLSSKNESPSKSAPVLMRDNWTDEGEVPRFKAWVETAVNQVALVPSAGQVQLTAFLSKPRTIRESLEIEIRDRLRAKCPSSDIRVNIFSGFKPGFFWIRDHLAPELTACNPDRVVIKFAETDHPGALELPIRWLQELYPIDEWLAAHLNMDPENIRFEKKPVDAPTYSVEAWQDHHMAGSWQLTVPTTRMPYLDDHFSMPVAVCAWLRVDGKTIAEAEIGGDRERFFRHYTGEFLPALTQKLFDNASAPVSEPLFSSLEVHAYMDEEAVVLGIDDEHIAPLEMLHEDIYFYTLAWFADVGEKRFNTPLNAPGAIVPFMHDSKNRPCAEIVVRGYTVPDRPSAKTLGLCIGKDTVTAEMVINGKKITRDVDLDGHVPDQKGAVSMSYTVARSFNNLPIRAMEITAPRVSPFRSPHALALFKPTILMETGHHGNEISSTPAMTELMEVLCADAFFYKRLNMVILHGSNPDGAALHRKLSAEHPHWMFHGARFNAMGLEFSTHYFKNSVFGEAHALPTLYKRWLPDVFIDNHGIPSHEWAQPYAGYNSPPMFRVSYWLPYALFYGIAVCPEEASYPEHTRAFKAVQSAVDAAFGSETAFMEKNRRLMARFRKYGHQWLPDKFPLENMGRHIFFYRMQHTPDPQSTQIGLRNPEQVTLHLITEVPDETVTGESLTLCKACQTRFNRTVLRWLASRQYSVSRRTGKGWIQLERSRPLISNRERSHP